MSFPLVNGATLPDVAAEARKRWQGHHVRIAARWNVDDVVAMDWVLQAQEAGLDVGKPRHVPAVRRKRSL